MDWDRVLTWPNGAYSRQVAGPAHRWHVQDHGSGPTILLLHGAGGSSHSMRHVFLRLSETHHVIALDLPGHGFTRLGARHRSGLQAMVDDIAALAASEGWKPQMIVGHSAGAAVALGLSDRLVTASGDVPKVAGINAALEEFKGVAGLLFPVVAKALALVPFAATLFSSTAARPDRIEALIKSTGSEVDAEGLALYRRLVADRAHVDGTLLMMAQWDLKPLLDRLPDMATQVLLLAASNDKTVPPDVSVQAAHKMKSANVVSLTDLGHLAHEEDPDQVVTLLRSFAST